MGLFGLLALWMLGVFEGGYFMTRLAAFVPRTDRLTSSFLSGLLVTLVATPCTAPFMGTALGVALVVKPLESFLIFTSLGLGVAAPYLILSMNPKWLKWVPKSGPWMDYLKKGFGLLMIGTVVWLGWVLYVQVSGPSVSLREPLSRSLSGSRDLSRQVLSTAHQDKNPSSNKEAWIPYSPSALEEALGRGQSVFINFTAKWCLSCQVNHRTTLSNKQVLATFQKQGVLLMEADWTSQDPLISQAISGYGRSGVPVYVYYPKNSQSSILLPEILTPRIVLEALVK